MKDITYDVIGQEYNKNRMADARILQTIINLLKLPKGNLIADIGAGTGNYTNALADSGYRLLAVEPSEVMRTQAVQNPSTTWISGRAECLPLKNTSVDGLVMVLAIHHFSDIRSAAREAARVCPAGPLVILTMDPRQSEKFWFNSYFPEIEQHVLIVFPPLNDIVDIFTSIGHWSAQTVNFPLPDDLTDMNMCSGWNRPEIYLDPLIRQNTSGFSLASLSGVHSGIVRLQNDLKSGKWDQCHGYLRKQPSFDAGFRFLKFRE